MPEYALFRELIPPTSGNAETIGVSLATEVVCQPGYLLGYEFVRPSVVTVGPFTAAFYDISSGVADPATVVTNITPSGIGRIPVLLPTPVFFPSVITARATIYHPSGRYAFLNNAFASDGLYPAGASNGDLFAPPSAATTQGNGLYVAGDSIAMPVNTFDETLYYISPIWSTENPNEKSGSFTVSVCAAASGTGTARRQGVVTLPTTVSVAGAGTACQQGSATQDVQLGVTGAGTGRRVGAMTPGVDVGVSVQGTARRSGSFIANISLTVNASGQVPGQAGARHQVRVGPPSSGWRIGPPTT